MKKLTGLTVVIALFIAGCGSTSPSKSGPRLTIYDPSPLDKFIIESPETSENLIVIQKMINEGHKVNRSTKNYYTPVITAIGENKVQFLEMLISNGGDLHNIPEFYGTKNAADIAVFPESLQMLKNNSLNVSTNHFAISYVYTGNLKKFKQLIESGEVSITSEDYKGRKFTLVATDGEQLKLFSYLMENGAPFKSIVDGKEVTPFSNIIRKQKSIDKSIYWLEKIPKKHFRNIPCGDLPLDADHLEYFIEKGARIVCQSKYTLGNKKYDYDFFNSFLSSFNTKTCNPNYDPQKLGKSDQLKCLATHRPYIFSSFLNAQNFDTSKLAERSANDEFSQTMEFLEKIYETEFYSSSSSFLHDYTKELILKSPDAIEKEIKTFELIVKMARNINVRDAEGNISLHYVQSAINYAEIAQKPKESLKPLKRILLAKGAKKDIRNNNGISTDTLEEQLDNYHKYGSIYPPNIESGDAEGKFNWMKSLASTVGFIAGNGLKLPPQEQARILTSIVQDGFSGDDSISNTMNAANQVAINARNQQTSQSYQDVSSSSSQVINSARLTGTSKRKVAGKWLAVSEAYRDLKRQCSNQQLSALSFNASFSQARGFVANVSGQCGTFNSEQIFIYWGYDYQKGDPYVGHREDEWLRKVQAETAVNACSQKGKSVNGLKILSKGNSDNATRDEFVDIFSGDLGYQWIAWELTCG